MSLFYTVIVIHFVQYAYNLNYVNKIHQTLTAMRLLVLETNKDFVLEPPTFAAV